MAFEQVRRLARLAPPPSVGDGVTTRPPAPPAALVALVQKDFSGTVLGTSGGELLFAVPTSHGDGQFVLRLAHTHAQIDGEIGQDARFDDAHVDWVEDEAPEVNEAIPLLIEALQGATGWHVESDLFGGFDPAGDCPRCHTERFAWEKRCAVCHADLAPIADEPEDAPQQRAHQLTEALLAEGLLELATPAGRAQVEARLSHLLARKLPSPAALLDLLADLPSVAEVYASEEDLGRLLARKT